MSDLRYDMQILKGSGSTKDDDCVKCGRCTLRVGLVNTLHSLTLCYSHDTSRFPVESKVLHL